MAPRLFLTPQPALHDTEHRDKKVSAWSGMVLGQKRYGPALVAPVSSLHGHGTCAVYPLSPVLSPPGALSLWVLPLSCPHKKHRCPHSHAPVPHTPLWVSVLGFQCWGTSGVAGVFTGCAYSGCRGSSPGPSALDSAWVCPQLNLKDFAV